MLRRAEQFVAESKTNSNWSSWRCIACPRPFQVSEEYKGLAESTNSTHVSNRNAKCVKFHFGLEAYVVQFGERPDSCRTPISGSLLGQVSVNIRSVLLLTYFPCIVSTVAPLQASTRITISLLNKC